MIYPLPKDFLELEAVDIKVPVNNGNWWRLVATLCITAIALALCYHIVMGDHYRGPTPQPSSEPAVRQPK